jgi:hypothetical protein
MREPAMRTRYIGILASVLAVWLVAGWLCVAIYWFIRFGLEPRPRGSRSEVVGGLRVGVQGAVRKGNKVVVSYSFEWVEDGRKDLGFVFLRDHGVVEVRFWDLWGNPMEGGEACWFAVSDDFASRRCRTFRWVAVFTPPRGATHFTLGLGRAERTTPKVWIPR